MRALRGFVLLGAFLLFAMEPMIGRLLLPDFGGAFHVWTTSLMFFQAALFVGYLYAHLAAERVGRLHLAMLAIPVVLLPPTVRVIGEGGDVGSLLATLALDAGNVPLVWVVPLALYLLTFVLAFADPGRVPQLVRRLWPHFAIVGLFFFAGADTTRYARYPAAQTHRCTVSPTSGSITRAYASSAISDPTFDHA